MSLISNIEEHKSRSKKISKWAAMLVDPQADAVRAPSLAPDYCAVANIVKSFDVDASVSLTSTVVVSPDPVAHVITSSGVSIAPISGPLSLDNVTGTPCQIVQTEATITKGILKVSLQNTIPTGTVNFIPDLGVINPILSGYGGLPLSVSGAVDIKNSLAFKQSTWFRMYTIKGTTITYYPARYAFANNSINNTDTVIAGGCDYVGFQIVSNASAPYSASQDINVSVSLETVAGTIPLSTYNLSSRVVSNDIIKEAQVSHVRCTSLKVLVTDMTPELDKGGEVVSIRNKAGLLLDGSTTLDLMSVIKAIPEQRTWRSGNIKDGCFVFYLPDDMESYEPGNPYERQSDNVIVVCLNFAKSTGKVRIMVTSTWEYYTPRQVIQRAINFAWDEESKDVFNKLLSMPACSENPAHGALIAGAIKLAKGAQAFYAANQHWINPAAKAVASTVGPMVMDKFSSNKAPSTKTSKPKKPKKKGPNSNTKM